MPTSTFYEDCHKEHLNSVLYLKGLEKESRL